MSNLPKLIWIVPYDRSEDSKWLDGSWDQVKDGDGDVEYVRKAIADELAEALKVCWDALDVRTLGNMNRIEAINQARTALSKYRETET